MWVLFKNPLKKLKNMNEIIEKYLNLKIEEKQILIKAISSISGPSLFCNLLTKKQYSGYTKETPLLIFKNGIINFIDENKENIIQNDIGNIGDIFSGLYIHKDYSFAMYYKSYDLNANVYICFCLLPGNEKLIDKFIDLNFKKYKKPKSLYISLLQEDQGEYNLKKYEVLSKIDLKIKDNYNDDFIDIDNKIFNFILNKKKSLTILHGLPGTGKTTYIKYLCNKLAIKGLDVVYLPPSITQMLSSPSFISNLDLFKDKVVIIEDAEEVLMQSTHRSQAIANILNITDGILSDIYNIHFIFTFNMDIGKIDKALLRRGRLTMKYEFKELTSEKRDKLAKKLNIKIPKNGTLAEMYNSDENGSEEINGTKLGF